MDILIKLFDIFNSVAGVLAKYIPQNKEDVLILGKRIFGLLIDLNGLTANVLGTDIQKIINSAVALLVKYFSIVFAYSIEIIKKLLEHSA